MKFVAVLTAFALVLLGWAPMASAKTLRDDDRYEVFTDAPKGQASCKLTIDGDTGSVRAVLTVELNARKGEAQIPELGLSHGTQQNCDQWPRGPNETTLLVGPGVFLFDLTLEVHQHRNNDCELDGKAEGEISAELVGGRRPTLTLELDDDCED